MATDSDYILETEKPEQDPMYCAHNDHCPFDHPCSFCKMYRYGMTDGISG